MKPQNYVIIITTIQKQETNKIFLQLLKYFTLQI